MQFCGNGMAHCFCIQTWFLWDGQLRTAWFSKAALHFGRDRASGEGCQFIDLILLLVELSQVQVIALDLRRIYRGNYKWKWFLVVPILPMDLPVGLDIISKPVGRHINTVCPTCLHKSRLAALFYRWNIFHLMHSIVLLVLENWNIWYSRTQEG